MQRDQVDNSQLLAESGLLWAMCGELRYRCMR